MSNKCYLCGSTDGKCNHFPAPPASHDAGEAVTEALEGIDIAKMESLGWQIALCTVCGMSASAFRPDPRIATLTAEVARLTAELAEAQRQRLPEGYITIPGEAWDAQMKIEGELERSRKECEGLREALTDLIGAVRHLKPCPATLEKAEALATNQEKNDE